MASTVLQFPHNRSEAVLKKLRKYYGTDANIQPKTLRFGKQITANDVDGTFTFEEGYVNDSGARDVLQETLSKTDVFAIVGMAVTIQKVDGDLNKNNATVQHYTYPDKVVFDDATVATSPAEFDALEAVYNGSISLKINSFEALDKLVLQAFRKATRTQDSATTQPSTEELFVDLPIPGIIEGKKRNELKFMKAPNADTSNIGGAAGEINILSFHFTGFIVRNASESVTGEELRTLLAS